MNRAWTWKSCWRIPSRARRQCARCGSVRGRYSISLSGVDFICWRTFDLPSFVW